MLRRAFAILALLVALPTGVVQADHGMPHEFHDEVDPILLSIFENKIYSLSSFAPVLCGIGESNQVLVSDLGVWSCVDKPTSSANPNWDDLITSVGDLAIEFDERETTFTWRSSTTNSAVLNGFEFGYEYRATISDGGEQNVVRIYQADSGGIKVGSPESILKIVSEENTSSDTATRALWLDITGNGKVAIAIDASDPNFTSVLQTENYNLTDSDFGVIADGKINLATEMTGVLRLQDGGTGVSTVDWGDSLFGIIDTVLVEIDTHAEFEAAAGGTDNYLIQTEIQTSALLDALVSDDTGSGALVFADTPTLVTPDIGTATVTELVFDSLGGTGQFIKLPDADGSNTVAIYAATAMGSDRGCVMDDDNTPMDGCVSHVTTIGELDTDTTGVQLTQLADGSDADDLHTHTAKNTAVQLHPRMFTLPDTAPAAQSKTTGLFEVATLVFEDSAVTAASTQFLVPVNFDGTTAPSAIIQWSTSVSASESVCWCFESASVTFGNPANPPASTDTNCTTGTAFAASGTMYFAVIAITPSDFVAGNMSYGRITRDVTGTGSGCTADNLGADAIYHNGWVSINED